MANPPKEPKTDQDKRKPNEDDVLRRLLNTPPKPHAKTSGKGKPKRKTKGEKTPAK